MSETEGDIRVGWTVTTKDGMVHLDIAGHAEMTMTSEQAEELARHLDVAARITRGA